MKVSIIIPAYNEQRTVVTLLRRVLKAKLPPGFTREVIIINDHSTDNTLKKIKSVVGKYKVISHPMNLGKGAGVRTGIVNCEGDLILIQDADLEYDPADYPRLLRPFSNSRVQAVYGSRLMDYPLRLFGPNKTPLPVHWLANHGLTWLTNALYGARITDMETCFKVLRTKLAQNLNLQSKGFDIEPEITAKILRRNLTIIEVPISVKPRTYSQGKKIGWQDGLIAIWTLLKYRFS